MLLNLGNHLLHHAVGSIEREGAAQPDQHQPCSRGRGNKCGSLVLHIMMLHAVQHMVSKSMRVCLRRHSDISAAWQLQLQVDMDTWQPTM